MKTNLLLITIATIIFSLFVAGILYPTGSPGAKTGSPLDGATCFQCHSGVEEISANWISTDIPESGWIPGTTYIITSTGVHPTAIKIGFELTAENVTEKVGTFIITEQDRTTLVNKNTAVTHKEAGNVTTDGVNSWNVSWTAPETNKGQITFYAAFNAANGNGSTSGDEIFTSAITYQQDASTTDAINLDNLSLKIYPNPCSDYIFIQSISDIIEVNFYRLNGSKLKSFSNFHSNNARVDLRDIDKGIYFVKVKTIEGEFNRRIHLK